MNNQINLLNSGKGLDYRKLKKRANLLRFIAVGFLFAVSIFSVVLFILISFSSLPEDQKRENQALLTISQLHPKMAKLLIVDERISQVNKVMTLRPAHEQTLTTINGQLPEETILTSFKVLEKTVDLTVASSSLTSVEEFFSNITALTGNGKKFGKVTIDNIVYNNIDNNYSVSLQIALL